MLHLPIERMAELVEGGASAAEREHLATCVACTHELEAYRRLVILASDERRRIAPPLTDWESLSARLRAEQLMVAPGEERRRDRRARLGALELFRRAAVVVVFVGGGAVLGRMSAGIPITDAVAFRNDSAAVPARPSAGAGAPVVAASNVIGFGTSQEALRALEDAQRQYEAAATWLSSHDTSSSVMAADQYRTRLAALDRTAETMQQAMREAPSDPYINQYYLATLSAREQTLRRLGTTLPVGSKLGRF